MAKPNMTLAEKKKLLQGLSDKIKTKDGKITIGFASDPDIAKKLEITYIPFPSLKLNNICGGGLPKGKISMVSGDSDSGKTSIILETIGLAMKEDEDFVALWLESESSISKEQLDMFGIDPSRFIYLELEETGAAEVAIDKMTSFLKTGALSLICINSIKCLTPSAEFEKDMSSQTIGLQARFMSKLMRKVTSIVNEHKVAFVMVNHLTTNIGQLHGNPLTHSCGRAVKYSSMLSIDFNKKSILDADPIPSSLKDSYMKIGASVRKNHCSVLTNPYKKCDYYVEYGKGTDTSGEIIDAAIENNYIVKAGAWLREYDEITGDIRILSDGTEAKWNGMKAFKLYLETMPEYFDYLKAKVEGKVIGEDMAEEEIQSIIAEENKTTDVVLEEQGVELDNVIEAPDTKSKKTKK